MNQSDALQVVMTSSEAAERWGKASSTIRNACNGYVKCPPRFKEGEARLSAGNLNPHGGCQVFEEQPGTPGACG